MLNEKFKRYIFAILALLVGIGCVCVLLAYTRPMQDLTYDLSLVSLEDNPVVDLETYDSKGWTVYTREGESVTPLIPDGIGGYTGLELGQTFYYTRVMEEALDAPTLRISPMECSFSVWLDDTLIYTDCPELPNQIGSLRLPMNSWYRESPILISLPADYLGRELTVAQSFPEWSETGTVKAWPAAVRLYCSYAYESTLISESFGVALVMGAAFLAVVLLLMDFVRSRDWSILFIALVGVLWMFQQLSTTSFFVKYFGAFGNIPMAAFPLLSALALLTVLTLRSSTHRKLLWVLLGISGAFVGTALVLYWIFPRFQVQGIPALVAENLPYWFCFGNLLVLLIRGILLRDRENRFYRIFIPLALAAIGIVWAWSAIVSGAELWEQLILNLSSGQILFVFSRFFQAITAATMVTTAVEVVTNEMQARTEQQLLAQRKELALESYENLRQQHEEVMILRHDMLRHFSILYDMDNDKQRRAYLEQLIGQEKQIRPVVECGNEMLDIILNSRLGSDRTAGIRVALPYLAAPARLPLSDPDLCALFLNLVDNAITAASAARDPYLLLKFHPKDGQLAIVCENSFDPCQTKKEEKKETVAKHGLGLKIVSNIVGKYNGVILTECTDDCFTVKVVIPLD